METKEFRRLKASEIEVRIQSVNNGGANLLLYKDARVDQNILDETFGIFGWKRTHQLIGDRLYCTVQVKNPDSGEWIEKQDVGTESYTEKEKGQASDSFKRACFNLGIGRELYTAPDIFYPKDALASYKAGENGGKPTCYDDFRVKEITYTKEKTIESVTIECLRYGKVHSSKVFRNCDNTNSDNTNADKIVPINSKQTEKTKPASNPVQENRSSTKPALESDGIRDDEIILVGNCKGKKYGDVKNTPTFLSFLRWAGVQGTYKCPTPEQQRQFEIFKKMAKKGA